MKKLIAILAVAMMIIAAKADQPGKTAKFVSVNKETGWITVIGFWTGNPSKKMKMTLCLGGVFISTIKEPYRTEAVEYLEKMIKGKKLTIDWGGVNSLAYVGKLFINLEMVKSGYGTGEDPGFSKAQQAMFKKAADEAKAAKRGMWRDEAPAQN